METAWLAAAARWALATVWALLAPQLTVAPAGNARDAASISAQPLTASVAGERRHRHRRPHDHRRRRHHRHAPRPLRVGGALTAAAGAPAGNGGNGGVATSIGQPGTVHLGDIGPNTHLAVDVSGGTQVVDQSGGSGNQQGVRPRATRSESHHRHRHGHRRHGHRHHHHRQR